MDNRLVKVFIFFIVAIFAVAIFPEYRSMFSDIKLRMDNKSYFGDDRTEDLVVELFTKQDTKHNSNTKETKRIMFSTSKYITEKDSNKTVNYVLNYVSNVGGSVNDIATEKISNGGLIIFRPKETVIKIIDIEVPKDAPFAENLEETLIKFISNEKYTREKYNERHIKNIVNN